MNDRKVDVLPFKERSINEVSGLSETLDRLIRRIEVSYMSDSMAKTYRRSIRDLCLFHHQLPDELDYDQIIDYLHHLKEKGLSWAKVKLDVAGFRYFWREVLDNEEMASKIPYPKEIKSRPTVLSRKELLQLFSSCKNQKHRVILRLIYSAGLRRSELIHLKITDIESQDGKLRVRVNKGKGNKDRYTVLSKKVLIELREYFTACKPKEYLFNGRKKGEPMSFGLLGHILKESRKRSGIKKNFCIHSLRHSFATHCIEDNMPLTTLQHLLGHMNIQTTLIYLHVSEVPLFRAFSPLDKIAE